MMVLLSIFFDNGIKFLPRGVCGCQLFTHGSFKFPVENDNDKNIETSETANCTASTANWDDRKVDNNPSGLKNISVPVVLEIDLRPPVIGL
ncbi:unnamed protein product [Trichobilharzia regenti]|uniref:Uncharacterized protein n=1 Tax=Trichobilharzia regenti TaxID=157069 RepID=A0A183W8F4_TRIRE|nr:unnamed protein product [Trichobilharzia regenti]VDQ04288.1 unnamed protein product [Trichobilharzia regenti]